MDTMATGQAPPDAAADRLDVKPARDGTTGRRRSVVRRRLGSVALVAALLIVTSGCNVVQNRHYGVSFGAGNPVSYYARIFQKPTWQIVVWNDAPVTNGMFCGGDELCTLRMLRGRVQFNAIGTWLADIDTFFRDGEVNDFGGALDQVRGNNKCLMLHRNPGNFLGDRHNWTQSDPGGDCKLGELVTA